MILPTLLALLHGDSRAMELAYFWAAVLLALTPVIIFGTIGGLVLRRIWKERQVTDEVGTLNSERGTEDPA
jgi:hypothetical protein